MGTKLDPIHELNHYYGGTVLSIVKDGIKYPFYANEFMRGDEKTYIVCAGSIAVKNINSFIWTPLIIPADEINYEYPELGYINFCQCAYYVERSPDRQYKKGVTEATLSYSRKANTLEYVEIYFGKVLDKFNDVEKWYSTFNPEYYKLSDLITKINSGDIYSGALCPKYAIQPLATSDKLVIMYKHSTIGYLKDKIGVLPKNNEHLVESLSEYMKVEVL